MNAQNQAIKTAIVTGGHAFDVINFQRLFRAMAGIEPYIQHMDDFASSSQATRDSYDVVLFYTMLLEGPSDEGLPGYAGKPRTTLAHIAESGQGIVMLHHTIVAYPDWGLWDALVGIQNRHMGDEFAYQLDQTIEIHVAKQDHSITQGLADWTMVDEIYHMNDAGPDSEILLTTEHADSMRTIAWTRQHQRARIFCLQSGHGARSWSNANFQRVLSRGIRWAAGKL